ncbi:hypothetical protein [uncultured Nostoc sp.]|uniref:hypothetical protein n=1 Tax=uncultured Nostoc sp. TaxID=340711 RepID=UPI0035CA140C
MLSLSYNEQTLLSGSQGEAINCWTTLRPAPPYEGAIINAATGLMEAQMRTLKTLEAVEVNSSCSMPTNFR